MLPGGTAEADGAVRRLLRAGAAARSAAGGTRAGPGGVAGPAGRGRSFSPEPGTEHRERQREEGVKTRGSRANLLGVHRLPATHTPRPWVSPAGRGRDSPAAVSVFVIVLGFFSFPVSGIK